VTAAAEMLALVEADARSFGCLDEVEHAHVILARGTAPSASWRTSRPRAPTGPTPNDAVVDWLIEEIVHGI
jgi:hypothetical protein